MESDLTVKRIWLALCSVAPLIAGAASGRAQLPEVVPAPVSEVHLGQLLFWDPILSGEQDVSCATCHHPDFGWADGRDLSLGPAATGLGPDRAQSADRDIPVVNRNAPSVLNTVFNGVDVRRRRRGQAATRTLDPNSAPMFWDNRVSSLESQALLPIETLEEMRGSAFAAEVAVDSVVARLRTLPEYVRLFDEAYGPEGIQSSTLAQAIAAYQRSLIAIDSPWDRFQQGDSTALTAQQQRGMRAFEQVGCDRCHEGPMFSDFELHAEGVRENSLLAVPDTGDGRFRFRTPTLRNVALTAPYMHNGTLASLEDVLAFYDNGRSENPNVASGGRRGRGDGGAAQLDRDFQRVRNMSDRQMADIVAFLEALTDTRFDRTVPETVPSGLNPGGSIGHHTGGVAGHEGGD